MSLYDVQPTSLIEAVAQKLKSVAAIKAPGWATFAKTGVHKERPPVNPEWWTIRAASMMRKIHFLGPVGVTKLRRKYSGKKNRGTAGKHTYPGSGNITRKILQQLEAAGFATQTVKGVHKGRILTPKGVSLLDKTAQEIGVLHKKEVPVIKAGVRTTELKKEIKVEKENGTILTGEEASTVKTKKEVSVSEKKE